MIVRLIETIRYLCEKHSLHLRKACSKLEGLALMQRMVLIKTPTKRNKTPCTRLWQFPTDKHFNGPVGADYMRTRCDQTIAEPLGASEAPLRLLPLQSGPVVSLRSRGDSNHRLQQTTYGGVSPPVDAPLLALTSSLADAALPGPWARR